MAKITLTKDTWTDTGLSGTVSFEYFGNGRLEVNGAISSPTDGIAVKSQYATVEVKSGSTLWAKSSIDGEIVVSDTINFNIPSSTGGGGTPVNPKIALFKDGTKLGDVNQLDVNTVNGLVVALDGSNAMKGNIDKIADSLDSQTDGTDTGKITTVNIDTADGLTASVSSGILTIGNSATPAPPPDVFNYGRLYFGLDDPTNFDERFLPLDGISSFDKTIYSDFYNYLDNLGLITLILTTPTDGQQLKFFEASGQVISPNLTGYYLKASTGVPFEFQEWKLPQFGQGQFTLAPQTVLSTDGNIFTDSNGSNSQNFDDNGDSGRDVVNFDVRGGLDAKYKGTTLQPQTFTAKVFMSMGANFTPTIAQEKIKQSNIAIWQKKLQVKAV